MPENKDQTGNLEDRVDGNQMGDRFLGSVVFFPPHFRLIQKAVEDYEGDFQQMVTDYRTLVDSESDPANRRSLDEQLGYATFLANFDTLLREGQYSVGDEPVETLAKLYALIIDAESTPFEGIPIPSRDAYRRSRASYKNPKTRSA